MKKQLITLFAVLLGLGGTLFAQNQIVNGDFESYSVYGQITSPSYTDYVRVNANYVVEAGHYVINTTTNGHGGGQQGWPNPSDSHGKYMIVNGFGGDSNPSKVVWKQTVNVTTQTDYTLSYRYVNLNRIIYGQINPAKLQVKINGANFGGVNTLPTNNNWHDWNNDGTKWNSGNATQAVIEIYDTYTGNEGLGDDFCLDDISFVPDAVYSVVANNDTWPLACIWTPVEIPVLDNDIISPGIQNATVQILQQPSHGEATVLSNKKIEYIFNDASFSGTDQMKYRVGFAAQGIYGEAWVYIQTGQAPVVANISAPGPICAGGVLGIPVPSVNPNVTGQWEYSSSSNGSFQTFDPNNIPLSMNGKYVRYSATTDCGEGHSNAVQITVTNGPTFSGSTPQIQPICAGQSLNLTAPTYNANGSQILSQGWVASQTETGDYTSFSLNNINASYNGWYIRYMVEGSCGYVYSNPARQLTVNVAPDVTGTLQIPEAICAGGDLNVTAPTYEGNGTGAWEICQNQNGTYQSFNVTNVSVNYNNWYLHYKVSNDCGSDVSNAVQIHVYDAPTVATPATPSAICAGGSFNLVTPSIQNNGSTITDQGWQIAAQPNGTYTAFNNNNVQYSYNGYYLRYYAVNECGDTYSAPVQITVNDVPIVGDITTPAGICAGGSFGLTAPSVQWRHTNQGTGSWEIQVNGVWQTLNNNNIPFSYNGCNIRYKAVNGCGTSYSSNLVQVTVYSTDPIDEGNITACDAIYHHGVYCNHDGNYVADSTTSNGCTIQVSWHFTLSEAYTETQSFTACESFTWPKNGQTYYSTCFDTYTYESSDPLVCDSIFTLDLTINNAPVFHENLEAPSSACAGSPLNVSVPSYSMNHANGDAHWEYAISQNGPFTSFDPATNNLGYGTYYLRYALSNECGDVNSNVVSFHINDTPITNMQLSAILVCEDDLLSLPEVNVNWRNDNEDDRIAQWQMSPTQNGSYAPIDPTTMPMQLSHSGNWLRFKAQNSCGFDVVGPVMITVISTEDQWLETITACDAYVLESGQIVNESTTIDFEVFEPCYHLVHQPIVINHSDHVVEPITSCQDMFEWHGMTFYNSEQTQYASVSLTNLYGCDSVVELQLDFGDHAKITETPQNVCDSYYWPRNQRTYLYDVDHPHIMDSVFIPGNETVCDSMIYLDFTMGRVWELQGDPKLECSGFIWHGVPYYADAIVYDSLLTEGTHCDSIIAYQLTIIPPVTKDTSMVSCKPVWWNGHYFEVDGDEYTHTFTSLYGCDSIVTMHFSLAALPPFEFDTIACEPFAWYGNYCDENGFYTHTFHTIHDCDSIVTLNVQFEELISPTEIIPMNPEIDLPHWVIPASEFQINSYEFALWESNPNAEWDSVTWRFENDIHWRLVPYGEKNRCCKVYVLEYVQDTVWLKANIFQENGCTPPDGIERKYWLVCSFYGIEDQIMQPDFSITPNPNNGQMTLRFEHLTGKINVKVYDMTGNLIDDMQTFNDLDSLSIPYDMKGRAEGMYFFVATSKEGTVTKKVVVTR